MTERFYRLLIGFSLLTILYFEWNPAMMAVIGLLIFEGVSNWRVPALITRLRHREPFEFRDSLELIPERQTGPRFPFDAERAWRLVVSVMLIVSYFFLYEQLWFFPWFMGFAIFGAGISGVCPVLISLKFIGFR